ncbi:hypothetical protein NTH51_001026 [Vibrio fluvialis]|nr:hypothetical protein [Vibrio fluvialis]
MKNIVLFDYQTVGQELVLCIPWVMNRAVGKVAATTDYYQRIKIDLTGVNILKM